MGSKLYGALTKLIPGIGFFAAIIWLPSDPLALGMGDFRLLLPDLKHILLLSLLPYVALCSEIACSAELIVHPDIEHSSLGAHSVRAFFTMRLRRWPNGSPVKVFVLPDRNPLHREFSKQVLGVFPHQLRVAWDRMVFSGTGQAPTEVGDEEEMIRRVGSTPGSIGYVSGQVGDKDVRFLRVD